MHPAKCDIEDTVRTETRQVNCLLSEAMWLIADPLAANWRAVEGREWQ